MLCQLICHACEAMGQECLRKKAGGMKRRSAGQCSQAREREGGREGEG